MKELLGLAVAVAGMTFGVSYANANPAVPAVGCDCAVVLRNGTVASFTGAAREEIHVRYAESGKSLTWSPPMSSPFTSQDAKPPKLGITNQEPPELDDAIPFG